MNVRTRVVLLGVAAALIAGCASTEPPAPSPPGTEIPPITGVPWTDSDLHFLREAMTVLEAERLPGGDADDPPTFPGTITLGEIATVGELVVAASFSQWERGRTVLVDADIVGARAASRLDRIVLRLQGGSVAGYLDVDSGRLPAALGLHWSGWERLGGGLWREPESHLVVAIPRSGGWTMSRGTEITAPLTETITGGAVARLAAAGALAAGETPEDSDTADATERDTSAAAPAAEPHSIPVILWIRGLAVAGIPAQALPSQLAFLLSPRDLSRGDSGDFEDGVLAHLVLPFESEGEARIALVALRLVSPRFLQEIGLERGPGFDILREGDELYLVNIALSKEQVVAFLKESAEFMTEDVER